MTVIAVLADPPREGLVLQELAATTPLTESEAADCYAAMLRDVVVAAARSGGDLLVNYRPEDLLPEAHADAGDPEAEVRAIVADALGTTENVRFEVQVGSSFDARAGNTATYLLEEGADSVAIVRGTAPFLARTQIDSAAMKIRSSPAVFGPSPRGRAYYAAFADAIDFADAFAPPELTTLTARAGDAGFDADFLPMQPIVERGEDLLTAIPLLEARLRAGRAVPEHFAAFLEESGLDVATEDGRLDLVRR